MRWEAQQTGAMYAFVGERRVGFVAPRYERRGWVWLIEAGAGDEPARSGACLEREDALMQFEAAWRLRDGAEPAPAGERRPGATMPGRYGLRLVRVLKRLWRRGVAPDQS